jgi:hypothetical protein
MAKPRAVSQSYLTEGRIGPNDNGGKITRPPRKSERFHSEDAALSGVGLDKRCVNRARVDGSGDAVPTDVIQRMPINSDAANRDDRAVLLHTNDRVVTLIGDIKVGALIHGRVARPVDVVRVSHNGCEADWRVQRG